MRRSFDYYDETHARAGGTKVSWADMLEECILNGQGRIKISNCK